MRTIGILLSIFVSIGYCTDTDNGHYVNVAFYCPLNKTWGYDIEVYSTFSDERAKVECDRKSNTLDTTFTFKCYSLIYPIPGIAITNEHSCTKNGDLQKIEINSKMPLSGPAFVAWNLVTNDHAIVYDKLFFEHMKEECEKDDCGRVRKQIQDSCNKNKDQNIKKQCHDGLKRALRVYCNSDGGNRHTICTEFVTTTSTTRSSSSTSTTTKLPESSNLVPIIIGASVATIVLIGGLIVCLKCRQSKKDEVLDPYGKTSRSKTKGTTTGSGTTTGESNKSTTERKKKRKKGKKEKKEKKGKKNKKATIGTTTGTKTGKKTGTEYI